MGSDGAEEEVPAEMVADAEAEVVGAAMSGGSRVSATVGLDQAMCSDTLTKFRSIMIWAIPV
jgi:hypothetical protein